MCSCIANVFFPVLFWGFFSRLSNDNDTRYRSSHAGGGLGDGMQRDAPQDFQNESEKEKNKNTCMPYRQWIFNSCLIFYYLMHEFHLSKKTSVNTHNILNPCHQKACYDAVSYNSSLYTNRSRRDRESWLNNKHFLKQSRDFK